MVDLLFSTALISSSVTSSLPAGFCLRPLSADDYRKGFLATLAQLTEVGSPSQEKFTERFEYFKKHNHEYFTIVIEDEKLETIVAAGTVFIERKFIRDNGLVFNFD